MFEGVLPALITPFKDDKIDFSALETLIDRHLAAGVSGFVLLGTTAETAALTDAEKEEIIKFSSQKINGKAKIIIGAGTNNTNATLRNIETAAKYGPDAVLVVTPYYNKPNLSGMIAHYTAAAKAGLPIVLYHIPGRTGQKLSVKFFEELLAAVPAIKAVKESDYDIAHITQMAVKFGGGRLNYICGNDDLWPAFLGMGSRCVISAGSNTFSPAFVKIYNLFCEGKTQEAILVFRAVYDIVDASFYEVNPTCCKYMLEKLGLCSSGVRLPLGPLAPETKQKIDAVLKAVDKNLLIK
ncbi:MAG: 4-hydroxy-tetrahydrodipicolinate synthase [Elusimicrobiota bacterium]|jgi:4-hydroxy-tetrahydrodipicolinate synthase|nr:4-hydroxy-tetrahydrodipicolinate synthase [Elusimicrobiota bacterium]